MYIWDQHSKVKTLYMNFPNQLQIKFQIEILCIASGMSAFLCITTDNVDRNICIYIK